MRAIRGKKGDTVPAQAELPFSAPAPPAAPPAAPMVPVPPAAEPPALSSSSLSTVNCQLSTAPHVWVTNRLQMFLPGRDFPAYLAPHMADTMQFTVPAAPNRWGVDQTIVTAQKATPELMALFEKKIVAMFRRYGVTPPGEDGPDGDFDDDDDPMADELRRYGPPPGQMNEHCRNVLAAMDALREAVRKSETQETEEPKETPPCTLNNSTMK